MQVRIFGEASPGGQGRPAPPVNLQLADGLLEATQQELRARSDGRREALALWAGPPGRPAVCVTHLLLPEFVSKRDHLTLPAPERHRLAAWLREHRLLVFSDLHTHPGRAFLSTADVGAPFSTRDGFYAIVVPNFGLGKPAIGWRMYEALAGRWREVRFPDRVRELCI